VARGDAITAEPGCSTTGARTRGAGSFALLLLAAVAVSTRRRRVR
jgi:uncharacterized protein (TIGR03382 family)